MRTATAPDAAVFATGVPTDPHADDTDEKIPHTGAVSCAIVAGFLFAMLVMVNSLHWSGTMAAKPPNSLNMFGMALVGVTVIVAFGAWGFPVLVQLLKKHAGATEPRLAELERQQAMIIGRQDEALVAIGALADLIREQRQKHTSGVDTVPLQHRHRHPAVLYASFSGKHSEQIDIAAEAIARRALEIVEERLQACDDRVRALDVLLANEQALQAAVGGGGSVTFLSNARSLGAPLTRPTEG